MGREYEAADNGPMLWYLSFSSESLSISLHQAGLLAWFCNTRLPGLSPVARMDIAFVCGCQSNRKNLTATGIAPVFHRTSLLIPTMGAGNQMRCKYAGICLYPSTKTALGFSTDQKSKRGCVMLSAKRGRVVGSIRQMATTPKTAPQKCASWLILSPPLLRMYCE